MNLFQIAAFLVLAGAPTPWVGAFTPQALDLEIHHVKPGKGQLLVAVCLEPDYLKPTCTYSIAVPVTAAPQTVRVPTLAPGKYAVVVVYDKNLNNEMDSTFYGAPSEPVGFSYNKTGKFSAPLFKDVAFEFRGAPLKFSIELY